jgi:ankyrin repeat protein
MGADPNCKDNDGHTVIHIAAQGDQVATIYFFMKRYELDLNAKDVRDSTALHWAAYLNKEIALSYLIAWGADIN